MHGTCVSSSHTGRERWFRSRLWRLGVVTALLLSDVPRAWAQRNDDDAPSGQRGLGRQCTTQDVLRGLCSAEEAAESASSAPFRVMGQFSLQVPVVVDRSSENDTSASYYLGGELDLPVSGWYATAWVGVLQRAVPFDRDETVWSASVFGRY